MVGVKLTHENADENEAEESNCANGAAKALQLYTYVHTVA